MPITKNINNIEQLVKDAIQKYAPNMSSFNSYDEIDDQAILNDNDHILLEHIDEIKRVPIIKLYDDIKIDITNDISFNATEYTDTEITAVKSYTDTEITTAKSYTDTEITAAKSYTDQKLHRYRNNSSQKLHRYRNNRIQKLHRYRNNNIKAIYGHRDFNTTNKHRNNNQ